MALMVRLSSAFDAVGVKNYNDAKAIAVGINYTLTAINNTHRHLHAKWSAWSAASEKRNFDLDQSIRICVPHSNAPRSGIPVRRPTARPWVPACAVIHHRQLRVTSLPGTFSRAIRSLCKVKSQTKCAIAKRISRFKPTTSPDAISHPQEYYPFALLSSDSTKPLHQSWILSDKDWKDESSGMTSSLSSFHAEWPYLNPTECLAWSLSAPSCANG